MIDGLNHKFAIKNKIAFFAGENNWPVVKVNTDWSEALIHLNGAHLTSFVNSQGRELIWLSSLAKYQSGKAIRGGIPICWPWFGKNKSDAQLPQHGFARTSLFDVKSVEELPQGEVAVSLGLNDNQHTLSLWPFEFNLIVNFIIGRSLKVELATTNTGNKPITLSEAIHTYFYVDDIRETRLVGLEQCEYFDQLSSDSRVQQKPVEFSEETDRIYSASKSELLLESSSADKKQKRLVKVKQANANSTVIWNPWIEKSKGMADFPSMGYINMVCIEAANTRELINIAPGESHTISQEIIC